MRDHGTHACYVWGPESGPGKGCRCNDCRTAAAVYERQRLQRIAPPYVGATVVRDHIAFLRERGVGLKTVAKRSGVSHGTLSKIVYGSSGRAPSKRVRVETRDKVLAVTPADAADGGRVDAGPSWEVIEQLLERGWTKAAISRAIGQDGRALQLSRHTVEARNARAVRALLDQPVPPRRSRHGLHIVEQPPEPAPHTEDVLPPPFRIDLTNEAWRAQSACRLPNVPPWLFFPGRGDAETTEAALAVCNRCPVRNDCLETHLSEKFGVWGGTTERQRRALRRERGIPDDDQADEEDEVA